MPKESRRALEELTLEGRLSIAEMVNHPEIKKEISSTLFPPPLLYMQYGQLRDRVIQLEAWQNEEVKSWPRSITQYIRRQHQLIGQILRKQHKSSIRRDIELWGYLDESSRISLAYPGIKSIIKRLGYDKYNTSASQNRKDRLIANELSSNAYSNLRGDKKLSRFILHDPFRAAITGFHGRRKIRIQPRTPEEAANFITQANLELAWLRSHPTSPETDLVIRAMCVLKSNYLDGMASNSRVEMTYDCDWYMDEFLLPDERSRVVSRWRQYRKEINEQKRIKNEQKRIKQEAAKKAEEKRRAEQKEHFQKFGGPAGARKSKRPVPKGGSVRTVQGGAPGLGKRKS